MAVHPTAARGFEAAAPAYERGRPGYPAEALEWIARRAAVGPASTVVDLAAGTGKLTRLLVQTGARVVAVEPVDSMRSTLEAVVPAAEAMAGTAESMPLPGSFADLVTVAQAFHWFSTDEALGEIHRVLRPGGTLALVWNRRDMSQPLQQQLAELISAYRADEPTQHGGAWGEALGRSPLFSAPGAAGRARRRRRRRNCAPAEATFAYSQHLDAEGVLDRVMSVSFLAALGAGERAELSDRVRGLVAGLPEPVELRYRTAVYLVESR